LQVERRRREHKRRVAIVHTVDDTQRRFGLARRRIAASIGISERTLRDWRRKLGDGRGGGVLRGRGRPTFTCDVETRNGVIRFLHHVTGPVVGLPALRALFPHVPRCVLENLLVRYRRVWRRRYCPWGKRLQWHVPGSVWAIDFSKAAYPIDGVHWYIFAVRDLGSSYQLAWRAVPGERAEEVLAILRSLFREHGAPLVLKSDNGSAFIAEVMRQAMQEERVVQLFSPAGRPSYNGGLERSNRVNKMYTAQHAIQAGHEHQWLASDLEQARQVANEITRPWGHEGPTPREAWEGREPLSDEQRGELLRLLEEERPCSAEQLGIDLSGTLNHTDRSRLDRHALLKVLTQLGYLTLHRGRRITRKPKRVTAEAIEQRSRSLSSSPTPSADNVNGQSPPDNANRPLPPGIANRKLPPLLTHRPCVDNARRGSDADRSTRSAPAPSTPPPSRPSEPDRDEPPQEAVPAGAPPPDTDCEQNLDTQAERTLTDGSTPPANTDCEQHVTSAECASAPSAEMLADSTGTFTMQAGDVASASTPCDVPQDTAARGERPFTSWWRRHVTPLVSALKAAINTG
jgi:transposase InsO family protein